MLFVNNHPEQFYHSKDAKRQSIAPSGKTRARSTARAKLTATTTKRSSINWAQCAGASNAQSILLPSELVGHAVRPSHHAEIVSPSTRKRLASLATYWLQPFIKQGEIRLQDIEKQVDHRSTSIGNTEMQSITRACPLVSVRNGRDIFVTMHPSNVLWSRNISGCINLLGGGFSRRLLTVLRMLRRTLRMHPSLKDFAFRLCVDDYCHGMREGRPLPLFTMVACETARTIPSVQWNSADKRDPDLSVWQGVRAELRARSPGRQRHTWAKRRAKAVWRGSIGEPFITNGNWTSRKVLMQSHFSNKEWKRQGRLALVHQHCQHPQLLDVRVVEGYRLLNIDDPDFMSCTDRHMQQFGRISLRQQAAEYKYVVHVEGHPGWADRLKHLFLSGMLVLKQDSGVREFYEPLFEPWLHYVPVDSMLSNLSDAVRWSRQEDVAAHEMALRAADVADEMLSEEALAVYQEELFIQYAALFREQPEALAAYRAKHVAHTARFGCIEGVWGLSDMGNDTRGGGGGGGDDEDGRASTNGIVRGIDCFYVRRGAAGSKTPMTMRRGSMRDARKTKLQR